MRQRTLTWTEYGDECGGYILLRLVETMFSGWSVVAYKEYPISALLLSRERDPENGRGYTACTVK